MISAGVVGASGFAGAEAVKWIVGHPQFKLTAIVSNSYEGQEIGDIYPALKDYCNLTFESLDVEKLSNSCEAVFLAVPHKAAMAIAPAFLKNGLKVFDLSADYRLKSKTTYEEWYETTHTSPELLSQAVYGMPEMNREALAKTNLVACPGCYPTASTLAVLPALKAGLVSAEVPAVVNALSGISGAGRSGGKNTQFSFSSESVSPYGQTGHRHVPEIAQNYHQLSGKDIDVLFTPHLVPMRRGLLSTVTLSLSRQVTEEEITQIYEQAYAGEKFVEFIGYAKAPQTADVARTNKAQVTVALQGEKSLVATCVIDNLGKGAASQAVQCANIVYGFDEDAGLDVVPAAL